MTTVFALKTAMTAILVNNPEINLMVTIDSDDQHSYTDLMKTVELAKQHPDDLVLGTSNSIETCH